MARSQLLAALVLAAGCGARTPLLPGGSGGSGGGGGGGGTGPLAVPCGAALLEGAPTPIRGYCSTRANQALLSGPSAPEVAWATAPFAIPDPENYLPAEIVVDADGRAYVAVNASPMNMAGGPNRVAAVDPDGTVAWTQYFPAPVSGLALGADGTLWMLQSSPPTDITAGPNVLIGLGSDGTNHASIELNPSQGDSGLVDPYGAFDLLAIGVDGSFFLGSSQAGGLARVTVTGQKLATLWTTAMGFDQLAPAPPVMLTQDDRVIAVGAEGLYALDASGSYLWGVPELDPFASGVDSSGRVVALETPGGNGTPISVDTIDGAGDTVASVGVSPSQIAVDAYGIALAGDGTTVVLLANETSAPGATKTHVEIVAIDASGKTRWTTGLDESLQFDPAALQNHYGLFVDSEGTVIVTAGVVTGISLSSGSVLWTVQAPSASSCLRPAVLGTGGSVVASQCDGTVFLARDR